MQLLKQLLIHLIISMLLLKKNILKSKGFTGLSKMKAADLDQALHDNFSEEELASHFSIRGYKLTPKGEEILEQY